MSQYVFLVPGFEPGQPGDLCLLRGMRVARRGTLPVTWQAEATTVPGVGTATLRVEDDLVFAGVTFGDTPEAGMARDAVEAGALKMDAPLVVEGAVLLRSQLPSASPYRATEGRLVTRGVIEGLVLSAGGSGLLVERPGGATKGYEPDGEWPSARFRVSDEAEDFDGDVVVQSGLDWQQFRANPIVKLAHRGDLPVGTSRDPRTGRVAVDYCPARRETYATVWFHCQTPESRQAAALVKAGVLNAASIGMVEVKGTPRRASNGRRGTHITSALVTEWSLVSLGANRRALACSVTDCSPAVAKALEEWPGKAMPHPPCTCGDGCLCDVDEDDVVGPAWREEDDWTAADVRALSRLESAAAETAAALAGVRDDVDRARGLLTEGEALAAAEGRSAATVAAVRDLRRQLYRLTGR